MAHASMSLPLGYRGPPLPTVLHRSRVNRMSLSPCSQRAGQGLPANLAPSVLHDHVIVGGLFYPGPLVDGSGVGSQEPHFPHQVPIPRRKYPRLEKKHNPRPGGCFLNMPRAEKSHPGPGVVRGPSSSRW